MSQAHALHNEQACDALFKLTGFNDWVVTTAYYAALYFLNHKIYPLTVEDKSFENPDEFWRANRLKYDGRHGAAVALAYQVVPEAAKEFHSLKDACMNARYKSYIVSDKIAIHARYCLSVVKRACT
jgi:hypothetical protein